MISGRADELIGRKVGWIINCGTSRDVGMREPDDHFGEKAQL